jgi:hypothetical protein
MRLLIKTGTLLGALFLGVSNSQAGLVVDLDGAVWGEANYQPLEDGAIPAGIDGYYGAQVYVDNKTELKFEFLGSGAWWRTEFDVINGQGVADKFVHRSQEAGFDAEDRLESFTMTFAGDQLLDFGFEIAKQDDQGNVYMNSVRNGVNPLPGELFSDDAVLDKGTPWRETAFWTGLEFDGEDLTAIYLGFNDGWSSPYDFDDMFIKVSVVTAVPLPASIPLFVFSLMSLGLFRRK